VDAIGEVRSLFSRAFIGLTRLLSHFSVSWSASEVRSAPTVPASCRSVASLKEKIQRSIFQFLYADAVDDNLKMTT